MRYIIIDDNTAFATALCVQFLKVTNEECNGKTYNEKPLQFKQGEETITIDFTNHTTAQIANAIIETYNNGEKKLPDDTVILINVNLKTDNSNRQDQKGIELLIWLRIKGIMNHVVLYSFETIHSLLQRKPKHLILTSKGTSFVQLPSDFEKIKVLIDKGGLKSVEEKDKVDIKQTLKTYFNVETIRHKEANWWGIRQLWDTHRVVISKSKTNFPYPNGVAAKENDLNSQVGVFIYEDEGKLGKALDGKLELREREKVFKKQNGNWIENAIDKNNAKNFSYKEASQSIEYILQQRTPKILHIDDQWNDGWGEVFSKMIYKDAQPSKASKQDLSLTLNYCIQKDNKKIPFFKCLKLNDFENFPNSAMTVIENQVKSFDMDLIILDLRLDPNSDKHKSVNEITGAVLLKAIREKFKGVPVLVTTASNKVWSYEELMKLGADAYWMKEGIDNNFTAEDTVKNYYKLLWLIEKLTSDRYKVVKEIAELYTYVSDINNQWWDACKNNKWANCEIINAKTDEVIKLFQSSLDLVKVYLHQFYLGYGYNNGVHQGFYLSSIVNKLGTVVEVIHDITEADFLNELNINKLLGFRKSNGKHINRGDSNGRQIKKERNIASHRDYEKVNWEEFLKFWKLIETYIKTKPNNNCDSIQDTVEIKKSLL